MTKAELIDAVKADLSKKAATEIVDKLFEVIAGSLKEEGKFAYPGFGSFVVRQRAARQGKNPRDKKTITIPARKTVVFRPASALKESL